MSDSLRLDPELAARAEALFRELGLDLSTAVHLFLLQSLREQGLPFTLRLTSSAEERRSSRNAGENEEAPAGMSDEMLRPSPADQTEPIPAFGEDAQHSQRADDEEPEKDDAVRLPPASEILPDEQDDDVDDDSDSEEHDGEFFHEPSRPAAAEENAFREMGDELRQAFLNARLIGAPLRRVRSLNRLYGIGEPNPHVQGWREVYVSGDEPFALDFGMIRVELGFHGGGSLRMMDGRLPDSVLEADAVYPRDLSAIFSSALERHHFWTASRRPRTGTALPALCQRLHAELHPGRRLGSAVADRRPRLDHVRPRNGMVARARRQDMERAAPHGRLNFSKERPQLRPLFSISLTGAD